MTSLATAALAYREALQTHREAKAALRAELLAAQNDGVPVRRLAELTGYSRQRIYQLLQKDA